jgi:ABC-type glycerol-3-phosphate transport system substrate-binding protein
MRERTTRLAGLRATAVGAAVVLGLSACGLGGAGGGAASTEKPPAADAPVEGTVVFQTLQLRPTYDAYINAVIDAFEKEHPKATVTWVDIPSDQAAQKLGADAVAGQLPDVIDATPELLAPLARRGLLVDMARDAAEVKDDFTSSAWSAFDLGDGKVVGLPWYFNTGVTMVNADLAREVGIDPEVAPSDYADLHAVALRLGRSGKKVYAFQPDLNVSLVNALLSQGVPMVDESGERAAYDTEEAARYLESLRELLEAGAIPPDTAVAQERTNLDTFMEGKTVFLESGPTRLALIEENAPEIFKALRVHPQITGETGRMWILGHGIAVPNSSDHRVAAEEFATFLTNAQNQLDFAHETVLFPSTAESLQDAYFTDGGDTVQEVARQIGSDQMLEAEPTERPAAVDAEFTKPLFEAAQAVVSGKKDAAAALEDAAAESTRILQSRSS